MLLEVKNLKKTIGAKDLFTDVSFSVMPEEKIALIGRNGHGKTTLLKILSNQDPDFDGQIHARKGIKLTLTQQEHDGHLDKTPFEYVIQSVPHYFTYKKILEDYENGVHVNIDKYLKILDKFTEHKFFNLPESIINTLSDFTISPEAAHQPLGNLSGGQKRYVEMTKMMYSQSDLLLIDEPTNHLDFMGKKRFITWMNSLKSTMVVVTHDRDVLNNVHKIYELKDQKLSTFKGNYDHYISHNTSKTLTSVKQYADQLNRLKEAKKKLDWGLRMRAKSKAWKIKYDQFLREYEKIKADTVKPSFWIDQDSVDNLDKKISDSYDKFKEKNITVTISGQKERGIKQLTVRNLSLGYDTPVFKNINFSLNNDDRVFIRGRNGAGKSTLVKTILSLSENEKTAATIFEGKITLGEHVRIGEYQQEINHKYLNLPLAEAIRRSYSEKNMQITDQKVRSLLNQYLFNPVTDYSQKIKNLSGGQKARFQVIKMLIDEPNLLILDEPTNHLDLPSIEELENALLNFEGAILYISHDSYFINKIGGSVVEL
jgi:ATP-binding cassette, subfamily F, member 3